MSVMLVQLDKALPEYAGLTGLDEECGNIFKKSRFTGQITIPFLFYIFKTDMTEDQYPKKKSINIIVIFYSNTSADRMKHCCFREIKEVGVWLRSLKPV